MRSGTWALCIGVLAVALWAPPARLLATTANDLCNAAANPCVVSSPITVTNGSTIDVGARELRIASGGALDVGSGTMTLRAGTLTIASGGFVRALGTPTTAGGTVTIEAGPITVGGTMDASGSPGGSLLITATGAFSATGSINAEALARDQVGGNIEINSAGMTLGGAISLLGGPDAIGGDLSLDTTGDLMVTGMITTEGGDGGGIDVRVGRPDNGANMVLAETSVLKCSATFAGGFAGAIDITVEGNGTTNGIATVNGQLLADGADASEELGGGSGGCVEVDASGDVLVQRSAAKLSAEGGAPDGDGGDVDLTSDNGSVVLQGSATAAVLGETSNGGAVSIDAAKDATLNGSIVITAGDGGGGDASISSSTASVSIARSAVIDVSSTNAGQGGGIDLESGTGAGAHAVTVEGRLIADGGPGGGSGGGIDLAGGDSVRIASTGSLHASSGTGSGGGGTITLRADHIAVIEGPITATGGGPSGPGGIVSVEAGGRISIDAATDARGFGTGGQIGFATDTGPLDILANVNASASSGKGGMVELTAGGSVRVAGTIVSDGTVSPGGRIEIVGCAVTVCGMNATSCPSGASGVMSSLGPSGVNRITGRSDPTAVFGTMRANQQNGRNELVYDGEASREPIVLGTVMPPANLIIDGSVQPCPICGNHDIEPPETCDDGNMNDGDGCSSTCQTESTTPGDANGDSVVSEDDIGFAIEEIFDGDGDSVTMVSGGSFPGAPGVDGNGDELVTAADVLATIRLLLP